VNAGWRSPTVCSTFTARIISPGARLFRMR
jgi:hypothetical protein